MADFQIFRETVLPSTLKPHALYIIAPTSKPNYIELYATTSDGSAVKRIIQDSDVQALINSSITALGQLQIVNTIPERNQLTPTTNKQVYVVDASADATVNSGGATYLYNTATSAWIKISEAESLDLVNNWDSIVGKPTSSVTQIDAAVANSHTHSNKTQLDKIGEDINGNFTYNNALPVTAWASIGW